MQTIATTPTPRTLELVRLIAAMTRSNGVTPSFRELAAEMRVSTGRVQYLVGRARACGLIHADYRRARSVRVVQTPTTIRQRAGRK